jgi:uncharacterized protein involved in exopolysaccharide biosynthesis
VSTDKNDPKETKSKEIDLLELFHKTWESRRLVLKFMLGFMIAGLVFCLISPKEYKSQVVLLVESSSQLSGMSGMLQQFSGLAGLSGLTVASGEEALSPQLYPEIINSTPFILGLLNDQLSDSKHDSALNLSVYLDKYTRLSPGRFIRRMPGRIIRIFKGRYNRKEVFVMPAQISPLKLSWKQSGLIEELSRRIKAEEGESMNTLIISVEMQDPVLVAHLTDSVVQSLTAYITDYRTQKAKNDLKFVQLSHREAEAKFKNTQRALADFKDKNVNLVTASGQLTEQNLQSDYTLAFNLYSSISQQLEQAKLKVQEKTPVFKIIDPSRVPLENSKPRTFMILVLMMIAGGAVGVSLIIGRMMIKSYL